jgi:ADP-ribose pyrophosphatase YjhB (NUDIX family)
VEFGETVAQAIHREIAEETNLTVRIERLIGVYSEPASQVYHYADRCVHYITTYFEGTLVSDFEEGFHNEETQQLSLFSLDALPTELAQLNPFWLQDALAATAGAFVR